MITDLGWTPHFHGNLSWTCHQGYGIYVFFDSKDDSVNYTITKGVHQGIKTNIICTSAGKDLDDAMQWCLDHANGLNPPYRVEVPKRVNTNTTDKVDDACYNECIQTQSNTSCQQLHANKLSTNLINMVMQLIGRVGRLLKSAMKS